MFEFLGGLLDNPARSVGINPDQIDPNQRWGLRGMTLQALGNQLQGGTPFYEGMNSIREGIDARHAAELKRQQEQAALAAQQAQQQQLSAVFGQDPMAGAQAAATQLAVGAPAELAGRPGPTVQRAGIQQAALQSISPGKMKAEQYRRAAQIVAATSPETAAKYIDIADKLDPREEFYAPTEANGQFFQASKSGAIQGINGFAPKAPQPPTSVQEFQFGQGNPAYNQWLLEQNKAKGTNVVNQLPGQSKFQDTLAAEWAKQMPVMETQAVKAAQMNEGLNRIISLAQQGTYNGALAPGVIGANQFLASFGLTADPQKLANSRESQALLNQLVLDFMGANGGARGFTEKETAILMDAFPKLIDDPGSRVRIARMLQNRNNEAIGVYNAARQRFSALAGQGAPFYIGPELKTTPAPSGDRRSLDSIFQPQRP